MTELKEIQTDLRRASGIRDLWSLILYGKNLSTSGPGWITVVLPEGLSFELLEIEVAHMLLLIEYLIQYVRMFFPQDRLP